MRIGVAGNSPSWRATLVVVLLVMTTGCGIKLPGSSKPSQPKETAAAKTTDEVKAPSESAKPGTNVSYEPNAKLPAEADDPAAGGLTVAKPASPAGSSVKPGVGSVTKPKATTAPNAAPKERLIGADRTSLATGSGTLPTLFASDKIELRDLAGKKKFSFKNKGTDAVKFYDAAGDELCKLTVSPDKLKAKSPDDKPQFELKYKADKSSLRLPPDEREVWKFKPRGERLEVHTGDDRLVYVVRQDKSAVVLERADGQLVCRAEHKGGSTTVTDSMGKFVISSASIVDPLAMVFFGWTELSPSQQAACLVFYLRKNPS